MFAPDQSVTFTDVHGATQTIAAAAFGTALKSGLPSTTLATAQLRALPGIGAAPLYSVPVGATLRALLGLPPTLTTLLASTADGVTMTFAQAQNPGLAADRAVPLALLALPGRAGDGDVYHESFDIAVESAGTPIYGFADANLAPDAANSLAAAMPAAPVATAARTGQPVSCAYTGAPSATEIWAALRGAFDPAQLMPADRAQAPRNVIQLSGGTDGALPATVDYAGEVAETLGSYGLAALEEIDEISIVLCPAAAADPAVHEAVVIEMQKHCRRMRYRVGVIEGAKASTIADIQAFRAQFSDSLLALYYPWVRAASLGPDGGEKLLPPSGFVAGVYADTDTRRGVHKAPANEVVLGALGLELYVNAHQQEVLNPVGVNCIRFFPNRGTRIWGGRTLSSDPDWRYVNVRRYFLYLEHSIERSTSWVVFEPNGEQLWANVRATVVDFLNAEWLGGRLLGGRAEQAFFVRCDRTTMTQNDLDNGRLVCLIGVAPLRPAEFVIFRIGQKTADS